MPIFIDESGFTGNDLLNAEQPYFVLSSVSISDAEAQDLVDRVRTEFQIEAEVDELKAGSLLKNPRGKKAVKYILDSLHGKYAISCNHKSYALCCKFFEYVFEPVLQKNKPLFYISNFHLFIAGSLFLRSFNKNKTAIKILVSFTKMMREMDFNALHPLFLNKTYSQTDQVLVAIIDFMEGYSDAIIEELEELKATRDHGKWTLDLSMNALWGLLRHWAKSHDELTVICDESNPLAALAPQLDVMIGEMDKPQFIIHTTGQPAPVFNLKQSIQFKDSKESAGIQLADVVASSATYALKKDDKSLLQILDEGNINESMFPTLEHVNLDKKQPPLNLKVLQELANRARNKSDPLLGMYEFIRKQYHTSPLRN